MTFCDLIGAAINLLWGQVGFRLSSSLYFLTFSLQVVNIQVCISNINFFHANSVPYDPFFFFFFLTTKFEEYKK